MKEHVINIAERDEIPSLQTPVQFLHGVGPARASLLERLELRTAEDVPRDALDLTHSNSSATVTDSLATPQQPQVDDSSQFGLFLDCDRNWNVPNPIIRGRDPDRLCIDSQKNSDSVFRKHGRIWINADTDSIRQLIADRYATATFIAKENQALSLNRDDVFLRDCFQIMFLRSRVAWT